MVLDAGYKAKQNKTEETGLKILTPRQMLQRLPIALAQVKAGNKANCLFFVSVKTNHYKRIQSHNSVNIMILHSKTYKRWILYLRIQKTVKHLSRIF